MDMQRGSLTGLLLHCVVTVNTRAARSRTRPVKGHKTLTKKTDRDLLRRRTDKGFFIVGDSRTIHSEPPRPPPPAKGGSLEVFPEGPPGVPPEDHAEGAAGGKKYAN